MIRCKRVCRQRRERGVQEGLGLGLEHVELFGPPGSGGVGVFATPAEGAVEVSPCPVNLAQRVAGHGQEEEVETIGLTLAGGEAFFQGGDRLGILARTVLGNAQRVEVDGCAGRQRDRLLGQDQRLLGIAQGSRAGGQPPGPVVVILGAGLRGFDSLLHIGPGLLAVAQSIMDLTAELVEGRILRDSAESVNRRPPEPPGVYRGEARPPRGGAGRDRARGQHRGPS